MSFLSRLFGGSDAPAEPPPTDVQYTVEVVSGTVTDAVLTYTGPDGGDVTVHAPVLPFAETVSVRDRPGTGHYVARLAGTTAGATVRIGIEARNAAAGQSQTQKDETYEYDVPAPFSASAAVALG